MKGLLVLAVDGLDWPALRAEQAAGRMPQFTRLQSRGVQARLAFPPQAAASVAARWLSFACGTGPAQHGIAHDLLGHADGLRLAPHTAADLQATPLWQHAWQAGLDARVVGWPATAGTRIPASAGPGSLCVADGFQRPEAGVQRAWPLAPDAVVPAAARTLVRSARMHPVEVTEAMLAALLPPEQGLPDAASPEPDLLSAASHAPDLLSAAPLALREATATLLARWASVHNLGVHLCEEGAAPLLMLRFDGLPAWRRSAAASGNATGQAEAGWLAWLDLMLGRYAALLADSGHVLLLADQGREDGSEGGMLVSGPRVAGSAWPAMLPAAQALALALGLLGLQPAAPQAGSSAGHAAGLIARLHAAPLCDDAALLWLQTQGVVPADLAPLRQRAQAVRAATLAGLAARDLGAG